MQTYIAGIPHRKPDLSLLKVGDLVTLHPEPENPFDPNAIRVHHDDIHLGYIPKIEAKFFSDVKEMRIVSITPESKWTEVLISTLP